MTATLLLLRHAQSTWNAVGRWQGQADPPLSPEGEGQAAAAAARLPRTLTAIVASDLERARRTAEAAGGRLGLAVRLDPRLRERDGGPWQGLTRAQIEEGWPGWLADQARRPDGYEPDADLVARVTPALEACADHTLVVTHGGVIAAVLAARGLGRHHPRNATGAWLRPGGAGVEPWPAP